MLIFGTKLRGSLLTKNYPPIYMKPKVGAHFVVWIVPWDGYLYRLLSLWKFPNDTLKYTEKLQRYCFVSYAKTCSIAVLRRTVRYRHVRERHGLIVLINLFEEQKKNFCRVFKRKMQISWTYNKMSTGWSMLWPSQQQESVVSNTGQLPCRVVSNTPFLVLRPIYSHPREG